jgi:sugar lactone lactonase YvrE
MQLSYRVVTPHCCLLGEGPVWDADAETICWVDILRGHIHQFSTTHQQLHTLDVREMVGAVALCTNGNFMAALKSGLAFIDRHTGDTRLLHHPEMHLPGNRFNDGKCDPAGRFWIGSMDLSEQAAAGSLYMIDKDLSCSVKIKGVSISNGMAWSPDHGTFYYIDTPTSGVVAYDYERASGRIANKRPIITIPKDEGFPDGMAIDRDGMLWIAHWDGWEVSRWDPQSGKKLLSIRLPAARITSCTFGGSDLRDLYVTSASVGLTDKQLAEQPLAGSLFVIQNCGSQGSGTYSFVH